jgi:LysR family transcriptional regulator, low CO2-responsive transcriptional regulator
MISASPRRLSVFKNVVDLGGFNAAATRLGIAQPSVGAHVKALESQIGQPLFHRRRGARPELTKAGEALYAFALDMLRKAEETTHALADLKASHASEITIAAHRDVAPTFLAQRLAVFAGKYPKARIVTRIGTVEEVLDLLDRQTANLGFVLSSGAIAGFQSEVLAREQIELVVSPDHPLAGRESVPTDTLAAYPFVTGLRASRYFHMVDAALRRIGLAHYAVAMELQESTAVKGVVRHGNVIACLPRCTVTEEIASGTLIALRLAAPAQSLEVRCLYRPPLPDMTVRFLAHLRANVAQSLRTRQ